MKIRYIIIAMMLALCFVVVGCDSGSSSQKGKDDYEIIETLNNEMKEISKSSVVSSVGDNGTWNIFELGLMYEKDDDFFKKLREDLGEDFQWKLSNGDSLFIGILPYKNSYRIYAGSPDKDHMLYPDWNYESLEKK